MTLDSLISLLTVCAPIATQGVFVMASRRDPKPWPPALVAAPGLAVVVIALVYILVMVSTPTVAHDFVAMIMYGNALIATWLAMLGSALAVVFWASGRVRAPDAGRVMAEHTQVSRTDP